MAAGLQGGTVLVFSVGSTEQGEAAAYGLIQSGSVNDTTELAEAKGADGNVVSVQEFDQKKSLSLTYLTLNTQSGEPAIGTTFTYNAVVYYIDSMNKTQTPDGFESVDITATHYPNLGA